MEVLRALAALCEPPGGGSARLARLLDLGVVPPQSEWSDLFLFQLHPYASVYLGEDGGIGGEARDRVAGFWRALELEPPAECDHLATMLAFQAELADRRRGAADDAAGERWRHVGRAFLAEHLLSWLPPYLTKLEQVAPEFYRRWGRLLGATLGAEARRLEPAAAPSMHWRAAPPLADPRRLGGRAFLGSLLAPVRSGLILTRADLERATRDLGLALRLGERRFLLETLLGQAPAPVLAWLADHCAGWRERLAAPRADGLAAGRHWLERAAATTRLLRELHREAERGAGP